jgi:hypothetical protein
MASIQQPLFPEALPSPLSSRPERSGAERSLCGCLFLEMFFDGAKPRDLQFHFTPNKCSCNPRRLFPRSVCETKLTQT